jgi:hypothetical protein
MMTREERLNDEVKRAIRDAERFATWEDYVASRPTLALLTSADVQEVRNAFDRHQTVEGFLGTSPDEPQD